MLFSIILEYLSHNDNLPRRRRAARRYVGTPIADYYHQNAYARGRHRHGFYFG